MEHLKKWHFFYPLIGLSAAFACFLLLIIVNTIPGNTIQPNVDESIRIVDQEGDYPLLYSHDDPTNTPKDNFTDRIMLQKTITSPDENILQRTMVGSYARYWHGYLVWLKPLLVVFELPQIRQIIIITFIILLVALAILISKYISIYLGVALLATFALFNIPIFTSSMQFANVFILSFIVSIILLAALIRGASKRFIYSLFIIVGIVTCFIDFLTTPIVTLGMPLLIYIAFLIKQRRHTNKDLVRPILIGALLWSLGYVFMWLLKWLLASAILQQDIFKDAIDQVFLHVSSGSHEAGSAGSYTHLGMLVTNLRHILFIKPISIAIIAIATIGVFIKYRRKKIALILPTILTIGAIGLSPVLWVLATLNHSSTHHWFTFRQFTISLFAGFIILWALYRKSDK